MDNTHLLFLSQDPSAPERYSAPFFLDYALQNTTPPSTCSCAGTAGWLRSHTPAPQDLNGLSAPLDRADGGLLEVRSESFERQTALPNKIFIFFSFE